MEKKKLNKTTKSNLITYGMVLAAYLIVQGMIAGNLLSNLMQGLLVSDLSREPLSEVLFWVSWRFLVKLISLHRWLMPLYSVF